MKRATKKVQYLLKSGMKGRTETICACSGKGSANLSNMDTRVHLEDSGSDMPIINRDETWHTAISIAINTP